MLTMANWRFLLTGDVDSHAQELQRLGVAYPCSAGSFYQETDPELKQRWESNCVKELAGYAAAVAVVIFAPGWWKAAAVVPVFAAGMSNLMQGSCDSLVAKRMEKKMYEQGICTEYTGPRPDQQAEGQ